MTKPVVVDELGAHISTAGGVDLAPERARDIQAVNLQLFTKQPNRWQETEIGEEKAAAFLAGREKWAIAFAGSHDSYLINLSTPDAGLWEKSAQSFQKELARCTVLGLDFLVTHPGNATDGEIESGWLRNADGVTRALEAVEGPTRVLLELTAGSGTSVGGSFDGLAAILEGIPAKLRKRVGVCVDTCHAFAAGYDLVDDFDSVWREFDDRLGMARLGLIHMNDSKHPLGSKKDRHEHIGKGTLGEGPFRRLMTDDRFSSIPKILETPKSEDLVSFDLENLALLRGFRRAG
jgi:deoxyribonuclease-4